VPVFILQVGQSEFRSFTYNRRSGLRHLRGLSHESSAALSGADVGAQVIVIRERHNQAAHRKDVIGSTSQGSAAGSGANHFRWVYDAIELVFRYDAQLQGGFL
jgi:hypothetical protein